MVAFGVSLQDASGGGKLNPRQINDFFEIGYVVLPGLFRVEEVREISDAFDRLREMARNLTRTRIFNGAQFVVEGSRIDRIVWAGAAEPCLLKYGEDPRIMGPVSQLLGSNTMSQLICQGHFKLPGDTVMFDWHQDSQHRGYGTPDWQDVNGRGSYVQTLMAVDEVTMDNGPVYFVPGSGKAGHLFLDQQDDPTRLFEIDVAVPLLMQPGDTAFFGPYVVHGSRPNNSNTSRRVFINGYAYPGANRRIYPGEGAGRMINHF